jgi:Sulfotransferase domain
MPNSKSSSSYETTTTTTKMTPTQPEPLPSELPLIPIGHPDIMMSKESVRRAVEEFKVKPTDILVATYPKTGTTLVTWLCHLIRVMAANNNNKNQGNNFDFEHHFQSLETLYQVVPWPLLSWDIGYDPNVDGNDYSPRVFKSHLRMASIYRGCKYIVTVRDPAKTVLSFYNFFLAKQVPLALAMDASTFLLETPFVQGKPGHRASLWEYYQDYHILKNCSSVLILVYEDLVQNMPENIRTIATFMNLQQQLSQDQISQVAGMATVTHVHVLSLLSIARTLWNGFYPTTKLRK